VIRAALAALLVTGAPLAAQDSREYAIRVQRTNYGLALGIGWLLGGTAVAAAGP
jgi:hypothetical protein